MQTKTTNSIRGSFFKLRSSFFFVVVVVVISTCLHDCVMRYRQLLSSNLISTRAVYNLCCGEELKCIIVESFFSPFGLDGLQNNKRNHRCTNPDKLINQSKSFAPCFEQCMYYTGKQHQKSIKVQQKMFSIAYSVQRISGNHDMTYSSLNLT